MSTDRTRTLAHARSGSREDHDLPEPSFAERTRTLLARQRIGYLSTLSRRQPGFPFGSVMPYAIDDHGQPLFLISKMAMHTQNLDREPRASLLVPEEDAARNPLGAARATLLGPAEPLPAGELDDARETYLTRHEDARYWVDYADFGFYRLAVVDVYYVGGFGVMGWVEADDYRRASPDPLADAAPGIIEHMNRDHADALAQIVAAQAGVASDEVTMTAVDRLGFHVRAKVDDRYRGVRIPFPREIRDPRATRAAMVELVNHARSKQTG